MSGMFGVPLSQETPTFSGVTQLDSALAVTWQEPITVQCNA